MVFLRFTVNVATLWPIQFVVLVKGQTSLRMSIPTPPCGWPIFRALRAFLFCRFCYYFIAIFPIWAIVWYMRSSYFRYFYLFPGSLLGDIELRAPPIEIVRGDGFYYRGLCSCCPLVLFSVSFVEYYSTFLFFVRFLFCALSFLARKF